LWIVLKAKLANQKPFQAQIFINGQVGKELIELMEANSEWAQSSENFVFPTYLA